MDKEGRSPLVLRGFPFFGISLIPVQQAGYKIDDSCEKINHHDCPACFFFIHSHVFTSFLCFYYTRFRLYRQAKIPYFLRFYRTFQHSCKITKRRLDLAMCQIKTSFLLPSYFLIHAYKSPPEIAIHRLRWRVFTLIFLFASSSNCCKD